MKFDLWGVLSLLMSISTIVGLVLSIDALKSIALGFAIAAGITIFFEKVIIAGEVAA